MALWLAASALMFAACSSSSQDAAPASSVLVAEEASATTTGAGDSEEIDTSDAPLVLAVPSGQATIALNTPTTGGGKHPLLEWSELPDAEYYGVYMYAPSGDPYWFWRGESASVYVGGAVQLDDDAMGVAVTAEMTWGVVGYASDGSVAGVSELAPLAP